MAVPITPRLVELTYEAALKSFWRKKALRKFLRGCHVSETFLATWSAEESKRDFLDRLFERLQRSDKGKTVIFQMARYLSDQTTFPDLRNWEDSDQKMAEARKAVAELKKYVDEKEQESKSEREREETKKRPARKKPESGVLRPTKVNFNPDSMTCTRKWGRRKAVMNLRPGSTIFSIFAESQTAGPT